MTRLFTDGAEMGDLAIWDSVGSSSVSTTTPRSGLYKIITPNNHAIMKTILPENELYIRFGHYFSNYTGNSRILTWFNNSTELGGIRYDPAMNKYMIYIGDSTYVASSILPLLVGTWCLVEVHIKLDDVNGKIELKINGLLDLTVFSGDTKPGTATTINGIRFGGYSDQWFDDIAINNISDAVDNSWCGDGHVINLTPNANGDSSQFVGNDSNSVDNYLLVDEVPSDSDTTYVQSATPNAKDLYNLTPCNLPADYKVLYVWAEARVKDTTTGAGTIKLLVKTEATEYESADINLSTVYAKRIGTLYNLNPNTGLPWTIAQLDALQVGIKVVD